MLAESLINKKVIFFGGKGGVGKTSLASSFALSMSKLAKRCLLVSTDPAHSLSDIFDLGLSGGDIISISPYLDCLEIDTSKEINLYIKTVKDNIKDISTSAIIEQEVLKQIDLAKQTPGATESAIFLKLSTIINNESTYDCIVIDTAPTGHTLRLLTLPTIMGAWISGMLVKRKNVEKIRKMWNNVVGEDTSSKEDRVSYILTQRKEQFSKVKDIIIDKDKTAFVFVLTAEKMPILETERAMSMLISYNIAVNAIVINKILPEHLNDTFFKQRKEQEIRYTKEIKERFKNNAIYSVKLQKEDIRGIDGINNIIPKVLS